MTYSRTATKEELENLSEAAKTDLQAKISEAQLHVDPMTYGPYVVIDDVRYDIEAAAKK
jgi:hypothetical protein